MPNLIKKSWTVSNTYVMPHKLTFHIRVCKTDFGHLPNKSLLKQGKLLLLLIFLFFPVKYAQQNIDWVKYIPLWQKLKKKRQTKRPQNAYLKSTNAENLLKTALLGPWTPVERKSVSSNVL